MEISNISSMDNTTNELDYITEIDNFSLSVGIIYICTGVIFIFLQLTCAYLISIDKEMQYPTYKLMINLSIADAIELIPLGIYSGITILIGIQNPTLHRWMSFICLTAWYTNCLLFAFIGFSRWVAITRSHLSGHIFRPTVMKILHFVSWVPAGAIVFYGTVIHEQNEFPFYPDKFSWRFNHETEMGEIWHWINFSTNTVTATVEMTFNILSLIWVHQKRTEIQTLPQSENRRREVKLLIQMFILGCVFTVTNFSFTLAYLLGKSSREALVATQAFWTFNHCVNPLVYLSVNKRLRENFRKFLLCRMSSISKVSPWSCKRQPR